MFARCCSRLTACSGVARVLRYRPGGWGETFDSDGAGSEGVPFRRGSRFGLTKEILHFMTAFIRCNNVSLHSVVDWRSFFLFYNCCLIAAPA